MNWIIALLGASVGVPAARSIVAEADAHRLRGEDRWWSPRCPECNAPLSATMMRCTAQDSHRQRIGNGVILVVVPVLLAVAALTVPSLWVWPAFALYTIVLVLLGVTDLDTKLIPNRILGPGTVACTALLVVGLAIARDSGSILTAFGGAVAYFATMYILAVVARGALGFGDVKLAFLIGMFTGFLGWGVVVAAGVGAFILGGVVSVVLLVSGRFGRKDAIPFGPFMIIAGLVGAFWGPSIVDWYIG